MKEISLSLEKKHAFDHIFPHALQELLQICLVFSSLKLFQGSNNDLKKHEI